MEKIEVTYNGADILAVNAASWRYWLGMAGLVAALLISIPVILVLSDGAFLGEAIEAIDWTFTGLVLAAVLAWISFVSVLSYWWRRWRGQLGPISFALTAEGVSFRSREMDGLVYWRAIKSVRAQGSRTFLFLSPRSAFTLPRRAFPDDAEFEAFFAAAQAYWSDARQ